MNFTNRLATSLLLLTLLTAPVVAQQKRQTPAKPQPSPTPAPSFESFVPADSYENFAQAVARKLVLEIASN